jgi:hypothetical protein
MNSPNPVTLLLGVSSPFLQRVLLRVAVVVVDEDVKAGAVLLVVRDLGEVEGPQLRKHDNHGRPGVNLMIFKMFAPKKWRKTGNKIDEN